MIICCLSDLHGYLPEIPDCDLLLLAGDYCPMSNVDKQRSWMKTKFSPWIDSLASRFPVIGISGNHDWIFQVRPADVPKISWIYLQDSETIISGLKVYGTPWQPTFYNWAFNLDEPKLARKFALIPDDTDILLTHGPPFGYGDNVYDARQHVGSPSLLKRVEEVQPKLLVSGHIHEGYGVYEIGPTKFVSASHVDEAYFPSNPATLVEI